MMKKIRHNLTLLSLILLFSSNTFANNDKSKEIVETSEKVKPKIIDEAEKDTPKKDSIKGGGKLQDIIRDINVSLSNIKEFYKVNRKDLHYPPYKCFIHHINDINTEIGISNNSTMSFKIKKSSLKVGDVIVVTNNIKNNSPFKQVIIEWIEIIK